MSRQKASGVSGISMGDLFDTSSARRSLRTLCRSASALGLALFLGVSTLTPAQTAQAQATPSVEPFPVPGHITVVDFGAKWCASCIPQREVIEKLQASASDKAAFVLIDIDDYPDIENRYLIEVLPTQIFYSSQGEPLTEHRGFIDEAGILAMVDKIRDYELTKVTGTAKKADKADKAQ